MPIVLVLPILITVWPENLTGIKFDEIASKLHNKNMMDFNLTKCPVRRHMYVHTYASIRKINIDEY